MEEIDKKTRTRCPILDSPVEYVRKQLPRGDGKWAGFEAVYGRLQRAAYRMADEKYMRCGEEHVMLMAILGCGHEETMKAEMHRLFGRGYVVFD